MYCDVAIVGGGLGGVAAALAACRLGCRVVMTEPTDWIGGQLTQQAVPLNEHRWIEFCGCSGSYRSFRQRVRQYYQAHYPLTEAARHTQPAFEQFNPGNAVACRLCHEPRVGVAVLEALLDEYIRSKQLNLLLEHQPIGVDVESDRVRNMTVESIPLGNAQEVSFKYVLDASETGELLALTETEYVTGSESSQQTQEPHASAITRPHNLQAVTACFGLDYQPGEDLTIDKPEMYDFWQSYQPTGWPGALLSWTDVDPRTIQPRYANLFTHHEHGQVHRGRWLNNRIMDRRNFIPESFASDVSLVNWPMNAYMLGPVYEVDSGEAERHIESAKHLSLSLLYWMQTEAPRPDGGLGYPGLGLRLDVVGTEDGMAKHVHVRDSRRIKAQFTVFEQHLTTECRPGESLAEPFADTVGVGHSHLCLHPTIEGDNCFFRPTVPFQIPLRALLPVRMRNLIPACRNIGTTHLSGSCYRAHPTEWNIGEAAGSLVAHCLKENLEPDAVAHDQTKLRAFQNLLADHGVELDWRRLPQEGTAGQ